MILKHVVTPLVFLSTSLVGFSASTAADGSGEFTPVEVASPVETIFSPMGFDSNDIAEVVLMGEFPNSCFKVGAVEAKVNEETKEIAIKAHSLSYNSNLCASVMVSFIQPVKVGVLAAGEYKVVVNAGLPQEKKGNLSVKVAVETTPDDYLYASASSVSFVTDLDNQIQELVLSGYYPYAFIGCFRISEIKSSFENRVLVVQPIMEEFQDSDSECLEPNQFEKRIHLDTFVSNALVHVRVLNGESINRYIPELN